MAWSEISSNPPPIRIRSSVDSNFQFEIDYVKSKDLPNGTRITSPTFSAGGFDWVIDLYPQGTRQSQWPHVSFFLRLRSKAENVIARYSFSFLPKRSKILSPPTFSDAANIFASYNGSWGYAFYIARDKLIDDYCEKGILVISCSIKVLTELKDVVNYPDGLCEHIKKLWEKGERCDVTFEVEGESIPAHRLILAARSPVFAAKLFGPMAEAKMERIKIVEMKAEVFKALLHFIYTDQLSIDESNDDATLSMELVQDLLVAADRYALAKLIVLCEEQLAKNLSVDTVATTLLLADRHSCTSLRKKCLDFASGPEIFSLVALTEGFLQIMHGSPSLFVELSEMVKSSSPLVYKLAKKRRTS